MAASSTVRVSFEPRGQALDLFMSRDEEVVLAGPYGSGKTKPILEKIHLLLSSVPNTRALVVRKTNTALTTSALVSYTEEVLKPQDGVKYFNGSKSKAPGYIYPNGSFLAVGGMDNPDRVLSTQYDIIYFNEVTEGSLKDWEALNGRLRHNILPFQQLIGDCNPSAPTHWVKQRANEGVIKLYSTTHRDNPVYFDGGVWTPKGLAYMKRLQNLTGVRRLRYLEGIWAAAEGQVYENFSRELHVVDRFPIPKEWPRYRSIDFGYTNPFVCLWGAVDPDGRLYIYRELYYSQRLVKEHARQITNLSQGEKILATIADHDAEDRATLHDAGIKTIRAKKKISPGIQSVQDRLAKAGDNKPRLFILRDSLVETDPILREQNKPIGLEQEFESYVWQVGTDGKPIKEEPLGVDDHGMDSLRYLCHHLVAAKGAVVPFAITRPSTWRNA